MDGCIVKNPSPARSCMEGRKTYEQRQNKSTPGSLLHAREVEVQTASNAMKIHLRLAFACEGG